MPSTQPKRYNGVTPSGKRIKPEFGARVNLERARHYMPRAMKYGEDVGGGFHMRVAEVAAELDALIAEVAS